MTKEQYDDAWLLIGTPFIDDTTRMVLLDECIEFEQSHPELIK